MSISLNEKTLDQLRKDVKRALDNNEATVSASIEMSLTEAVTLITTNNNSAAPKKVKTSGVVRKAGAGRPPVIVTAVKEAKSIEDVDEAKNWIAENEEEANTILEAYKVKKAEAKKTINEPKGDSTSPAIDDSEASKPTETSSTEASSESNNEDDDDAVMREIADA